MTRNHNPEKSSKKYIAEDSTTDPDIVKEDALNTENIKGDESAGDLKPEDS